MIKVNLQKAERIGRERSFEGFEESDSGWFPIFLLHSEPLMLFESWEVRGIKISSTSKSRGGTIGNVIILPGNILGGKLHHLMKKAL